MLAADHHKLNEIFKQFDKLRDRESGKEKALHVQKACDELRMHVQITDDIFYPALRRVIAGDPLLDATGVTHAETLALIEHIEVMDVDDDRYEAKFSMLGDQLDRLIQIESGLFSRVRETRIDTVAMGERLLKRKIEWLMDEMGLPDDSDEAIAAPNYSMPVNGDERGARSGRVHASLNRF